MKYGEQFEQESVPQWSLHNIDYNSLKHHIKVHTTKDQATAIAIPGQPNRVLGKFEDDLYQELCRQHDRVGLFVTSKADEIARRLQHLSNQVHRLILRCATSGRDRVPLKRQQRFAKYEQTLLQCGDDIKSLQRFVNAQIVAFRKILKKYRKWTGSSTLGSRFRDNVLSHPKSFTRRDFSRLQSQYNDLSETLHAALPADADGRIALPPPRSQPPRPSSSQLSPSETVVAQDSQPTGYWNEYECGSEAGDHADTDYAIYIDPNEDTFPAFKALTLFFTKPISKLTAWVSGRPKPTSTSDPEQGPLLPTTHSTSDNSPYGSTGTRTPTASPSYFTSLPGGGGSTLDPSSSSSSPASPRPQTSASSQFSHSSNQWFFPPGYATYYPSSYTSPHQHHHEQMVLIRYRARVLRWATLCSFAAAYLLMGLATVLIATGRNKMRLEVDAGVTLAVMASLGLACAGLCMTLAVEGVGEGSGREVGGNRQRSGSVDGRERRGSLLKKGESWDNSLRRSWLLKGLVGLAFVGCCVGDGVLLVLVVGGARM
ncbi:hypothetical protein VTI74DRAFT_7667 [Chaetomium olivicolor]